MGATLTRAGSPSGPSALARCLATALLCSWVLLLISWKVTSSGEAMKIEE